MYKIYLGIDDGEEGFIIPYLPEKIEISEGGDNKTYNIINVGEVNVINLPKLTNISFESHFPLNNYQDLEKFFNPSVYIKKIKEWRSKLQKIRLIFTGGPLEINDLFSIENFKYEEHGGEVGDIYYSLELKRYRPYSARKVIVQTVTNKDLAAAPIVIATPAATAREENPPTTKEYTVVEGDTLWHIAKMYLGDGSRYPEIASLNNISNPDLIYPGQVFQIPQ